MKRQEWITLNLLMIPLYSMLMTVLFGGQVGGIYWPMVIVTLLLCPPGAWLLSKGKNLRSRSVGLLCYSAMGAYQALSHFFQPNSQYGPWTFDVYMGAAVVLMGVVVFIIRRQYR